MSTCELQKVVRRDDRGNIVVEVSWLSDQWPFRYSNSGGATIGATSHISFFFYQSRASYSLLSAEIVLRVCKPLSFVHLLQSSRKGWKSQGQTSQG